ncbi:MAG TPA: NosD domain-containing protein [Candidatus Bathyarchaeia archaeon]|nr:NosD domain-containing protein [Candidatus Bathyarchaeia archaeon]
MSLVWTIATVLLILTAGVLPRASFYASAHPGTLSVPSQYSTIQAAVNAAVSGDTILVAPGIYRESVVVIKSVNITGASRDTTVIDPAGAGPGVNITLASGVSLQGFTINDTGLFDPAIFVNSSSLVVISNNKLSASVQSNGVTVLDSSQVSVTNNLLTGDLYGVAVQGGFGNNIRFNNATGNVAGVRIYSSSGNKITDNIIRKDQVGLELWAGSTGNVALRNLVANDSFWGVSVQNSRNNLVAENNIEFNNADPRNTEGINLQNAVGNRFYHNNIRSNSIQASAVFPPGDQNIWDNATGATLKTDSKIMFVDTNGNGVWNFNETVVYDTDGNGVYDLGEPVIGSVNGMMPLPGTMLKSFSGLKFVDRYGDGIWRRGDPVVNDTNNDNLFEAGETAISAVGGNFWSDYSGKDNGANGFGLNGIGDTLIPWPCPNGGASTAPCPAGSPREEDWYPLMKSWVPPNMNVTASASPFLGYPPVQVSFQGKVAGGAAPYNYTWNFGEGSTGVGSGVVHSYAVKGSYVAVLTVSDSGFRTRSDSVAISVVVGTLLVRVVDGNKKPVVGADIGSTVQPAGQPALSGKVNNSGLVTFSDLRNGSYTIRAASIGFVAGSKGVVISLNRLTNATITLSPSPAPASSLWLFAVGGGAAAGVAAVAGFLVWRSRRKKRASHEGPPTSVPGANVAQP